MLEPQTLGEFWFFHFPFLNIAENDSKNYSFYHFRQEWPKTRKKFIKPKKLYGCGAFWTFSWIFLTLSFWVIFGWFSRANFRFFDFWGSKIQKLKNFIKYEKSVCLKLKNYIFEIFQFLNFWPPKVKKTKIGSGKSAKNDPKAQNQKNSWKSPNSTTTIQFFWLNDFFLVLGHSCQKW